MLVTTLGSVLEKPPPRGHFLCVILLSVGPIPALKTPKTVHLQGEGCGGGGAGGGVELLRDGFREVVRVELRRRAEGVAGGGG